MKKTYNTQKTKRTGGIIVCLWVAVCFGCETVIDLDLPEHEPAIILNGFIHPDSIVRIQLSENRFILDGEYQFEPVTDATVNLYANGSLVGQLTEADEPGDYVINHHPVAGVDYRITAEKKGYETVEATEVIPNLESGVDIISVESKRSEYEQIFHLTYSIDDPPGNNYYETRLYKWQVYSVEGYADEDTSYAIISRELVEIDYNAVGAELNEFEGGRINYFFSDELFDGRKNEFTIEFYNYGEFHAPPGEEPTDDTSRLILQVRQVSESYYRYVSTLQLQSEVDGNPFAEPVQVYNNIENGFGIFAGYASDTVHFEMIFKPE